MIAPALFSLAGCQSSDQAVVVVYTSQDLVYAEPILRTFEKETGIKTLAVYDSEAVKTVGLVNRLLAESRRPQCDVFWNNEEFRTRQLAARGIFRETNGWAAFGYRSRRLVLRDDAGLPLPTSLQDLTNSAWRGRISMAYPLFGTTATHLMALRQRWGREAWNAWCRHLADNHPFLEEGNSQVPQRLKRGEARLGWTDSDDIAAAHREGWTNGIVLPVNSETLLIPNTVAVIRNAPHPEAAQRLFDYLQRSSVRAVLLQENALEGTDAASVAEPTLKPDWPAMLRDLEESTQTLQTIFLR